MLRTLYAKLSLVLLLLLLGIGLLYALISSSLTKHYLQQVNQQFNRDLASKLVADRNLVAEGRLHEPALRETFRQYMVINPSIEIYLLDLDGTILSYSADPGKVKRKSVSLEPIRAFLQGRGEYPLLGDDPRSHDRHKAFSVTPVPSTEHPRGYLYVVLRGEEFEAVEEVIRDSYFSRLSAWALAGSLGFGLLAGLLIFHLLTRRLHRLSADMDDFQHSNFTAHTPYTSQPGSAPDEVDRLGLAFDQMANRISAQLDLLRDQDRLRRTLVAQVSHDLRTPLASLHGYLESLQLKEAELSPVQRSEYLAIALRQTERLTRLVSELFELAKLEAQETRPSPEPFAAAELTQDVVQKFHLGATRRGISLKLSPPPALPLVHADIALTERVLDNLIENAIEHTPAGGGVVLSLGRKGQCVQVDISDSGGGVADRDLPHIFTPFYRAEEEKESNSHAGLGLAIAQRIVTLQGGEIQAVNKPDGGSVFSFTLPLEQL
jgi:signal transduction histidine kinase